MKKKSGFEKFFKDAAKTGGAKKEEFRQAKREVRKEREEGIANAKRQKRAQKNAASSNEPPKYNLDPPGTRYQKKEDPKKGRSYSAPGKSTGRPAANFKSRSNDKPYWKKDDRSSAKPVLKKKGNFTTDTQPDRAHNNKPSRDYTKPADRSLKPTNRKDGGYKPERSAKPERDVKPERTDNFNRTGRPQGTDRPQRTERPQRSEQSVRPQRTERTERPQRSQGNEKPQRRQSTDRPQRSDRTERPQRTAQPDRNIRLEKSVSTARPPKVGAHKMAGAKSSAPAAKTDADLMPLNKYISHSGVCSRRDAVGLIKGGKVKVNGELILEPGHKVALTDDVKVAGKKMNPVKDFVYILLNKPKDYITTTEDPQERKTVLDLLKGAPDIRIYPVGRLDRNTSGVLLLTNDGDLSQKLTHPSNEIKKVYAVTLDKPLTKAHFEQILKGVELEDGPAIIDTLAFTDTKDLTQVGVELHSGRNRIVRRLFEHLGYDVKALDRVVFAGLTKKNITRGKWRFLNEKEVRDLKFFKRGR